MMKRIAPLSKVMIKTLKEACICQNKNIPFGPVDLGGAFVALINRGLIVNENVIIRGRMHSKWKVIPEAISLLKNLGIDTDSRK